MKNIKGEIYVTVCVFILAIVMVFSVVFTYGSLITEIKIQKTNAEIVFDSFVANNSIIIFNNIKQGKNAVNGVNTDAYISKLKEFCTLEEREGKLYCMDTGGSEKYSMNVPAIGYIQEDVLELYAEYTMYLPVKFAGITVTTAQVPVKISSSLTSKN